MNNNERYCDRFNMSASEFQSYKSSKKTRIFLYLVCMFVVTFFYARVLGYVVITFWLISSYVHDAKREEQWIKDGSVRPEDLL